MTNLYPEQGLPASSYSSETSPISHCYKQQNRKTGLARKHPDIRLVWK